MNGPREIQPVRAHGLWVKLDCTPDNKASTRCPKGQPTRAAEQIYERGGACP